MARSSRNSGGVNSVARFPESLSTKYVWLPCQIPRRTGGRDEVFVSGGFVNDSTGNRSSAAFINSCHKGATMYAAIFFIGRLSLFPAQAPTASDGVYPTIQASLKSLVVPVFAATSRPGK